MVITEQTVIKIIVGKRAEVVSNLLTQYAESANMSANQSTLRFAYIGDEIRQKIDEIIDLYNLLGHLKSFTAYMNNRLMYNLDFVNLKKIFECHHSRPCKRQSFGCQYLSSVKLYQSSPNGPFWFEYGHLESADVWIIDKPQILKVIEKEIKQNLIYFCPQFSLEHIKSVVSKLPDKIIISEHPELELFQRDNMAVTGEPTKWELGFKSKKDEMLKIMEKIEQEIVKLHFKNRNN